MPQIVCNIIEVCVFSFKNKEPLYLMLRRSPSENLYPGAWQIITGSIETGETALQAAVRELKEETDYVPQKLWIVPHVNTFFSTKDDTLNHTVVFAAQVLPGSNPALSNEHHQFTWCTIDEAKKLCVWPGQIHALHIIHEFIVKGSSASKFSEIQL
jgi:dATP pyrophosphohydrolase